MSCGGDKLQFYYIYVPIILFVVLFILFKRRKSVIAKRIVEKRNQKENKEMVELAKRFIDKECIINTFDGSHQYTGIVKEVTDGAVLIERNGQLEAINSDYILRIREYPVDKKGKKKSVIFD